MKRIVAVIIMISILTSIIPVVAADRYETLLNQFVTTYTGKLEDQSDKDYWSKNKKILTSKLLMMLREAQGLNAIEWQAFSAGILDAGKNKDMELLFGNIDDFEILSRITRSGWSFVEKYWITTDSTLWTYDAQKDYSAQIIKVVEDTLNDLKSMGYTVEDTILETMPESCAQRVNEFDLSSQELNLMLYQIRDILLSRAEYVGTEDISRTLDFLDFYFRNIKETRLLRASRLYDFKGDEPSSWAKFDVAMSILQGIVPPQLQGDYHKPITREEFASLFVNLVFTWHEKEFYDFSLVLSKEKYLSTVTATDYNFTDVDNEDVKLAYLMGFVNGVSDTKFMPDLSITRQEAAMMLTNYFQSTMLYDSYDNDFKNCISDLNKASSWGADALLLCYVNDYLSGSKSRNEVTPKNKAKLDPLGYFTREQAILVAKRINEKFSTFMPVNIRGTIGYDDMINFVVSKNSVTAVSLNDQYTGSEYENGINYLLAHDDFKAYSTASKPEQIVAMTMGRYYLMDLLWERMDITKFLRAFGLKGWSMSLTLAISDEMLSALYSGKNHVIDMGWSTVEINGDGFIYQYKLKRNGFYTGRFYGGTKCTKIENKLIR